ILPHVIEVRSRVAGGGEDRVFQTESAKKPQVMARIGPRRRISASSWGLRRKSIGSRNFAGLVALAITLIRTVKPCPIIVAAINYHGGDIRGSSPQVKPVNGADAILLRPNQILDVIRAAI